MTLPPQAREAEQRANHPRPDLRKGDTCGQAMTAADESVAVGAVALLVEPDGDIPAGISGIALAR
jgi:hypothetical protein